MDPMPVFPRKDEPQSVPARFSTLFLARINVMTVEKIHTSTRIGPQPCNSKVSPITDLYNVTTVEIVARKSALFKHPSVY